MLPKPAMVVRPLTSTAMIVLRARSGPPCSRSSMNRSTTLSPNSAAVPMMSGSPKMLPIVNLRPQQRHEADHPQETEREGHEREQRLAARAGS